jgi:glycosyltransferase involved in cell wall biosynthesis
MHLASALSEHLLLPFGLSVTALTICHVLWSLELGGAERVVVDLAKMQRAQGHRVAVLTLSNLSGPLAGELRGRVDTLDSIAKRERGVDLTLPLRLARWFLANRIQVVHTHNELPLIYAAPAGKLARAVVVHSKHGVVPVTRGAHWLRRVAAGAVDVFVAVSEATAETARATGECAPEKLRVVINGTDLSRFPAPPGAGAAIRKELGIPASAQVLITIGRLVKEKNHRLLLQAVAPLLGEDRRLVVVGDGPLREELSAGVKQLPSGHYVHLTGARRDAPALLASADAFVLSSDSEGLPIGLLEAWAAGLPVVSTAVGGIPAAIRSGETGLLVPPGDQGALTAALRRVLDEDATLAGMAERGRAHALATYSAEQMANAYLSLYEECCAR